MSMSMKLSFKTLPDPFLEPKEDPSSLIVSHTVTIGNEQSINVLQTTCKHAVSEWFDSLDTTTSAKSGEIVAGLNLLTEKYEWSLKSHVALIVLCVGSSCLFYYNPYSLVFCNYRRVLYGSGVGQSFAEFCARPGIKLVCTGHPKGVKKLAKCVEFGKPPTMMEQLIERSLLGWQEKLGEESDDTAAIWERPVILGDMAGNTYDDRWTGSNLCQLVFNAYIASEVGKFAL